MSKKSARIAAMIERHRDRALPPHYLGYFECFNQGLYYEAHDVLEELWLEHRHSPNGSLYKGLIQLAGAFVHLQKNRLRPSAALFKLARTNLQKYPSLHESLNIDQTRAVIHDWLAQLESTNFSANPLNDKPAPKLYLIDSEC